MNSSDHFLRRAYYRARHGLFVWFLSLAALVCATAFGTRLGWWPAGEISTLAIAALASAAVVILFIWMLRARRLTHAANAHHLDTEWSLAARLEASAELAADPSALAAAQRADAASHLVGRRIPSTGVWFGGFALLVMAILILLAEFSVFSFRLLHRSPAPTAQAAPEPDISASIIWKSPESEIKATTIEQIPLAALVSTRTGFRILLLEVAVNGEPRLSRPLDPAALAPFTKAGEFPLALDLYLDEVGAEEFDIVSYHLRGERTTTRPAPVIASPLQFIQIRPPREDVVRRKADGSCDLVKLSNLIGELKVAQLQLLKQNFLLAHAPIDHALPIWRDENTLAAADQKTLAQKTAEVREVAIAKAMPALVVDNLGQCVPLMESAAALIAAGTNEPAAKPQGHALGLITAVEKLIRKAIIEGGSGPPPPPAVKDPFKDTQKFKPSPRSETPAGQLEQLARDQEAVAAQDESVKDPLATQSDIAAKLAALAAAHSLDPSAQEKTEQAAKDAAEAAHQLKQGDPQAARAPATAAAQALRQAIAAQEAAARAAAQDALEKIRRELNTAEHLSDPAERAAALAAAAEKLQTEAEQQQQTGSAEAAHQLAAVANTAKEGKGEAKGEGNGEGDGQGQSNVASTAAAQAYAALTPRSQALARAARQLARGSNPSSGSGPGGGGPSLSEMQLGAQLAAELLADPAARKFASNLASDLRNVANSVVSPDLRGAAEHLISLIETARSAGKRDEQIRRFNPDELVPSYRAAIEAYFEKLSRDAKPSR